MPVPAGTGDTRTDQPGEAAATQAALAGCTDWVATVQQHSADWCTASVRIGPPNTTWLMEIGLQWDAGERCYDVVDERESPTP